MPVLQPASFQQTAFQNQQYQPTPYPSSSQALQPMPSAGPVAGMPYPQLMPQPSATGQQYGAGVNPYQPYPYGVPGQQGVAVSLFLSGLWKLCYKLKPHSFIVPNENVTDASSLQCIPTNLPIPLSNASCSVCSRFDIHLLIHSLPRISLT